jgi:surface carbohydrate biosynthesis protein (TIGR04326 family)
LPELLRRQGKKLNWLHIFLFSPTVPDTATGNRWLQSFNRNVDTQGNHAFLDAFLGWEVLRKVLYDWWKLQLCYLWLGREVEQAVSEHPLGWLWPTLRAEWKDSVIGVTAMQNLLWVHLFDKALSVIPHQKLGLYLCENQGWERAFVYAWRKHGHGTLIGVAHSTIRYWDLRYFDRCVAESSGNSQDLPQPDKIAVNGPMAWENLEQAGQTMRNYVQVEAQRYLYLNDLSKQTSNFNDQTQTKKQKTIFLLLGDIQRDTTHRMLSEVEQSFPHLQEKYDILLKPHPANSVNLARYPQLNAKLTSLPLAELFPQVVLVLASVHTSAALDAFCAGIPVINYLDPSDFNFSPLRGIQGAKFINSAEELIEAVEHVDTEIWQNGEPEDFFWLDSDLPRWRKLLELDSCK